MNHKKTLAVTAPSGGGKSTLVTFIETHYPGKFGFSVSCTTRLHRAGDKHDAYYYLDHNQFFSRVQDGDMLEYQEVYRGQFYGTSKSEVHRVQSEGKILLLDVDIQGAIELKENMKRDLILVFITAKDNLINTLKKRLETRGDTSEESMNERLKKAVTETIDGEKAADYIVVNNLSTTKKELYQQIVEIIKEEFGLDPIDF